MRLSPEYSLVARAAFGPAAGAVEGDRALDWLVALSLAERHRLSPLLDRYVRAHGLDIPAIARSRLEEATLATAAKNLLLLGALGTILDTLAAADIPVMLLKGAALLEMAYSDIGLRPMLDLDLLVPAGDARRAEAAIVALGYRPNPLQSPPLHEWMREQHHSGPALIRDDNMVAVDLHRHLSSGVPHLDIDDVWSAAHAGHGPGTYLLPAFEDMLVHVALHFCADRKRKSDSALGQLADLAWLSAMTGSDWQLVLRRADRWRVTDRLYFALSCATELLGPIAPASVLDKLRPADFVTDMVGEAIRSRVLGTRPWVSPDYLASRAGTSYASAARPLRRLFPSHEYLIARAGTLGHDESYARLYVRRASSALSSLARPWGVPAAIRLGRWLDSLDAEGSG